MRLVLDTCVIVAAVKSAAGASRALLGLVEAKRIEMVLSVALLNEYEEVLFREVRAGWTTEDLTEMLSSFVQSAELIAPSFSYRPMLRDPDDEFVLEAAINGHADIVTFNVRDFAPASQFGVRVWRPSEVLNHLRGG